MIDRYSREEIKKIWDLNSKFDYYLKVEIAVCEAYSKLGKIPKKEVDEIKKRAKFSIERIDEIEREVRHDVIAFLTCVNESLGEDLARHMHIGMTSSDVIDTAFALQIQDSGKIIKTDLDETIKSLKDLAKKKNCTMAQLSLAWMLCKEDFIVPIPGSRKVNRLTENFEAQDVKLINYEIEKIDALLDSIDFDIFGGHSS